VIRAEGAFECEINYINWNFINRLRFNYGKPIGVR
jgi:hypothetical protein